MLNHENAAEKQPGSNQHEQASAISPVTIMERRRLGERPSEADRLSSFRLVVISVRDAFSAGARPHMTAQTSETPAVKSTTFQSRLNGTAVTASLKVKLARSR